MKTSDLIYTWAIIFFATALLASGGAAVIAWILGVMCWIGGIICVNNEYN